MASTEQQQQQEGVINPFRVDDREGWLREEGISGHLAYSGGVAGGKAEGRGTIRHKENKCTIRGATFRAGTMLPCRAVLAFDQGDAYAGPLAPYGLPADGARGAVVRGADGGRFEGTWPANGMDNNWFAPLHGVAWVPDGSVHAVALDGTSQTCIFSVGAGGSGWRPGGAGWERLGVLTAVGPTGQVALSGTDPLWAVAEYEAEFAFADGRRLEGTFRGLCPQRGVLTDADGRRWRVAYSGDALLAADVRPVTTEEEEPPLESALAGLPPDAAAAAAAWLRAEGVTAAQLRSGAVTDADLEDAGLAAGARGAIAAWLSRDQDRGAAALAAAPLPP